MNTAGHTKPTTDVGTQASQIAEPRSTCSNCATPLQGSYCHHCGQQQGTSIRNVFSLIQEFFGEIGNWDSRVIRTLVPLLIRPGFLSQEYVAGRRAPYVPPLRLYLFSSIVCFLMLFAYFGNIGQQINDERSNGKTPPAATPQPTDYTSGPLELAFLTPAQQAKFNLQVQRVNDNPELLIRQVKSQAPQMMFFLLPFFALILKAVYLFSKRYYMEHLILALHTHAFLFVMLTLWIPLDMLDSAANLPSWFNGILNIVSTAWFVWLFVYLFLCQKFFYQQSWAMTTFKYCVTGALYCSMLLLGVVLLFIASVLTV